MIIDCVSDLHGFYPELSGGDLLIIAGDLTSRDIPEQYGDFVKWQYQQKYKKIIFIAGNHDVYIEKRADLYIDGCDPDGKVIYLQDSGTEFEGLKIWGSPWTKTFPGMNPKCMAFTLDMYESLLPKWNLIPDDVDILVTHGPPYGILDGCGEYGACAGDVNLRQELEQRIKPKLHIFGHIHENGGKQIIFKRPGYGTENNTICINASHVNERYKPVNKPVRIIL